MLVIDQKLDQYTAADRSSSNATEEVKVRENTGPILEFTSERIRGEFGELNRIGIERVFLDALT